MEVTSYWGPAAPFSKRSPTYTWAPQSTQEGPGRPLNPEADPIIREIIETALAARGFTKTSAGDPGFRIDYRIARAKRGEPAYDGTAFAEYEEGSLILYVLDPANGQLVWRGHVQGRLDRSVPPGEQRERVSRAVELLLDKVKTRPKGDRVPA